MHRRFASIRHAQSPRLESPSRAASPGLMWDRKTSRSLPSAQEPMATDMIMPSGSNADRVDGNASTLVVEPDDELI